MYKNSLPFRNIPKNCTLQLLAPIQFIQKRSSDYSKSVLLLLLALLCTISSYAQDITVKGKVSDSQGSGIPGVNILIKGSAKGTTTDVEGAYEIAAPANATLVFSFIGYTNQEVAIGGKSIVNVTLTDDITNLNEIVVTAMGIERSAKSLTYSTQKLDGKQLADVRDANFVNTLSGKVAGLVVTQGSSGPGSATRVVLRGNRSVSGSNNALFVVDGVPIDNSVGSQVGGDFGGRNRSDGASNINPDDIESMNVLKGAAASALYGSRAANGVIMITTKKGKAGKVSADINSGVVVETPFLLPSLQNTYGQGSGGKSENNSASSWGAPATTYPNNMRDFYRNGISTNNSIGISTGSEKTQTYLSYTHNGNQGIVPNNSLQRHTMNLRINSQVTKKLSVDGKITYVNQNIDNKPYSGENSGPIMNLLKVPRSVDLNDYKNYQDENGNPTYWASSSIYMNPYWTMGKTFSKEQRDRSTILGSAKYDLTSWLNVQGRISYDTYTDEYKNGWSDKTLIYAAKGGNYEHFIGKRLERNLDLIFSGNNKINEDFNITYNVGAGQTYQRYGETGANATGLSVTNKFDLNFATNLTRVATFNEKQVQYVFGTAAISFRDYLTVDASVRNDWSSTLPSPHSYLYSAFGANYILSDAVELPNWISFAKIRGSWAQVGNDTDAYRLDQSYSYTPGGLIGYVSRGVTRVAENLKPEISSSTEFGFDLRVFNNRLGLDVTYYNSNTVNQLLTLSLATASGFSNQFINAGKINNEGVEIVLSGSPVKNDKITWETALNFARNVNTIVELHPDVIKAYVGGGTNIGRMAGPVVSKGGSYGDMYGYTWLRDAQGRYVVGSNGVPLIGPEDKIGNFNPKFTLGWNNTINYKNFVLNVLVDGRVGGTMTSGTEANLAFDGTADYTTEHRDGGWVLPAVTTSGEVNTTPINAERFWQTVSQGRYSWGEFFTYSATNFRLRELSVGYNIRVPQDFFFKNMRISFTARNLFFLYRGNATMDIPGLSNKRKLPFDPDMSLGAGNYQGVDYANMPSTRTIGLNLKLGF